MPLDNLEYITIENQTTDFPKHFHETFCISLIHKGIELINFNDTSVYSEAGSISITNPYEVHANPLTESNSSLKFDTLYISNDLMKYFTGGKNIRFTNRVINCTKTNQLFIELKKALDSGHTALIESCLFNFITTLKIYAEEGEIAHSELNLNNFDQIARHIETHIHDKFCLDELSKMANINKYGFVKKFKLSTGMTPMNYILMNKIFSSKKLIYPNSELTEIAYKYNFTDMAHFSKTFKRFIGLSPKKYQESIIAKI